MNVEFWLEVAEQWAGTCCDELSWFYLLCIEADMRPADAMYDRL